MTSVSLLSLHVSSKKFWTTSFNTQYFNAAKSNVLYLYLKGPNPADTLNWRLGEERIESSNSYMYSYLGILLRCNFDPGERTSNTCRKRQQAYFAFKTSEQLNLITVAKLYKKWSYHRFFMEANYGVIFGQETLDHSPHFNIASVFLPVQWQF